jgi:hypothetical protein
MPHDRYRRQGGRRRLVTDPAVGHEVEAFDVWRIRWFLDEADDGYGNKEVLTACNRLAKGGPPA